MVWKILLLIYIVMGMITTLILSDKEFTWRCVIKDISTFLIWPFWFVTFIVMFVRIVNHPDEFADNLDSYVDGLNEKFNSLDASDEDKREMNELTKLLKQETDNISNRNGKGSIERVNEIINKMKELVFSKDPTDEKFENLTNEINGEIDNLKEKQQHLKEIKQKAEEIKKSHHEEN